MAETENAPEAPNKTKAQAQHSINDKDRERVGSDHKGHDRDQECTDDNDRDRVFLQTSRHHSFPLRNFPVMPCGSSRSSTTAATSSATSPITGEMAKVKT